jgi:hypothetical protein
MDTIGAMVMYGAVGLGLLYFFVRRLMIRRGRRGPRE